MVMQAYSCIGSAIIIANLTPGNISQDVKFNSSLEDVFYLRAMKVFTFVSFIGTYYVIKAEVV